MVVRTDVAGATTTDKETTMKLISSVLTLSIVACGMAQSTSTNPGLSSLGNLVKRNAMGDYHFPGASKFMHNGSREFVHEFAVKLSRSQADVSANEDVMMQGITLWEDQMKEKGFNGDLAASFAFYTLVNVGLAKGDEYKEYLLPNLVAQNRKAFQSSWMASLTNSQKQRMYDYMLAESVYLQALAAIGPERRPAQLTGGIRSFASDQVSQTFGRNAASLWIDDAGLRL